MGVSHRSKDTGRSIAKREEARLTAPVPLADEVYKLALIHCTVEEIAAVLNVSHETIYAHFPDVLQRGHKEGQQSLKRKMHEVAMNGDVKMLIWLSKQRLGYRESFPEEAQILNFNVVVNEIPK